MKFLQPIIKAAVFMLIALTLNCHTSFASTITINPVADGSIYTCDSCNPVSNGSAVLVSSYIQGIVEFSMAEITSPIANATFSLNPHALPLHGERMELYGYSSTDGILTAEDGFAGTFLGYWDLPPLVFGQDTYFDVSNFLSTISSPFVGFNIRSYTGTNVFSSLEHNYGHPAQLTVSFAPAPIPEPSTLLLFLLAVLGLVTFRKRHITN